MTKKSEEEYVLDIQEACRELGWQIGLSGIETGVKGLIIGTEDFVNETVEQLANGDEFEIWDIPETDLGIH